MIKFAVPTLTEKHLNDINAALRGLHDMQPVIQKMMSVGMDVKDLQDMVNERQTILEAMKKEFFQAQP